MLPSPIDEQVPVIQHPLGQHARVIATAGAGKTTTLVHRVQHLIDEHRFRGSDILVVAFNRLAATQFRERLERCDFSGGNLPQVHTFHALAYRIIQDAARLQLLAPQEAKGLRSDDQLEYAGYVLKRIIEGLEKHGRINEGEIELNEAAQAIGLWKGALIPPGRAGHHHQPALPIIYDAFERERKQKGMTTFDDFVPRAVELLTQSETLRDRWCGRHRQIIVDEYQDINHGQQVLVEMIADGSTDIMVVGDDSQTIYEWRGARPDYILTGFEQRLTDRPHRLYRLKHSFRFGPLMAQTAHNTIRRNRKRLDNSLIAHNARKQAKILIHHAVGTLAGTEEGMAKVNDDLAERVFTLVTQQGVEPSEIAVLSRTYAQLAGLESGFLKRHIPYRVIDQKPFFQRSEAELLLAYLWLAVAYCGTGSGPGGWKDLPVDQTTVDALRRTVNVPLRKLTGAVIEKTAGQAMWGGQTLPDLFRLWLDAHDSPFAYYQRETLGEWNLLIARSAEMVKQGRPVGEVLTFIVEYSGLSRHYDNFHGQGEASKERKDTLYALVSYGMATGRTTLDFLHHVAALDPTQGAAEEDLIKMSTVYKTKGLEFDHVFIPDCVDGFMPCRVGGSVGIYDTAGIVEQPEASDEMENERRLFYVAITRAKSSLHIGTSVGAPIDPAGSQSLGSQSPGSHPASAAARKVPQSSPFLTEMQLEETERLIDKLQRLMPDTAPDAGITRADVLPFGGATDVLANIEYYAGQIGGEDHGRAVRSLVRSVAQEQPATQVSSTPTVAPTSAPADVKRPSPKTADSFSALLNSSRGQGTPNPWGRPRGS